MNDDFDDDDHDDYDDDSDDVKGVFLDGNKQLCRKLAYFDAESNSSNVVTYDTALNHSIHMIQYEQHSIIVFI